LKTVAESIKKKRSLRAEREFGLIVGGVLFLLSSWWIYRGKFSSVSHITIVVGPALILLGLVLPQALVLPNKAWMALAEALAFVSTRIILAFVFFGIVTPIGVVKRLFGWDPLNRRAAKRDSYWKPYTERQRDPRHYEKMF
jgi:polyferredoxin